MRKLKWTTLEVILIAVACVFFGFYAGRYYEVHTRSFAPVINVDYDPCKDTEAKKYQGKGVKKYDGRRPKKAQYLAVE